MRRQNISPAFPDMVMQPMDTGEVVTNSPRNIGRLHQAFPGTVFEETVIGHLYQKNYFRTAKKTRWYDVMWGNPPLKLMSRYIKKGKILEDDFVEALRELHTEIEGYPHGHRQLYVYDESFIRRLFDPKKSARQILRVILEQWPDVPWDRRMHPFFNCPIRTPVTLIRFKEGGQG